MNPSGIVIGNHDIPPGCCGGYLAAGGPHERSEAGEDLNYRLGRVVDLYVSATQLDLRHNRTTTHSACNFWQDEVTDDVVIGKDASAGSDIHVLPEFCDKTER